MLKQKIQSDIKESMKAKDSVSVMVLRMTVAAINAKQTEERYKISKDAPEKTEEVLIAESELSDDEIIGVLASEIKKRKDAIVLYEQGGRPELAELEKNEITILQKYLPEQLSADEIKKLVEEAVASTGAKEMRDMGKVMAELNPKIKGRADGKVVSDMVKELLK